MRLLVLAIGLTVVLPAAPPIADKVAGLEKLAGFVPVYWDAKQGKMLLEASRWGEEFLYVSSLPAGIGSNDIGLDRGQLGRTRLVRFERVGPRILLVQANTGYRAGTGDRDERQAVRDSFAESVLWGFDVVGEEGGRALVDATAFFLRDVHGIPERLQRARQGAYRLEASRSAFYLPRTKGFPRNTEVEVTLTFTGGPAGAWLSSVTPSPDAVTVREHHSFVALPEPGYRARAFDPRAGYFPIDYSDYATPIDQPLVKRFIRRHRLEKKNPSEAVSEPVKPIVYYLDRGTPEPVRSALLEGARWWNAAFEAAGFRNAFRVEMMPQDADPMDVRYNVIQWVHRSTRGWSYGASVVDPRTGEILKGHVTLGSLRVRQDFLIAEAYLAPYAPGANNAEMMAMSLQRLRQLSAHEVGHTLGLGHNYIASAQGNASVMDYPHPRIELKPDGTPTLANAYPSGVGEWDKLSIAWGYRQFAAGENEPALLDEMLTDAARKGLYFLTDQDARPEGSSDPQTHLWDNGANAVDELDRLMKVRAAALRRFGENVLKPGTPLALLEDALVPLYFGHRYQVEAAVKTVGGIRYRYALRGDGQPATEMIPAAEQARALRAVLDTMKPAALSLPEALLRRMPPRPAGIDRTRELARGRTLMSFDPLSAAESAASLSAGLLLHPMRVNRLVLLEAREPSQPGLARMLNEVSRQIFNSPRSAGMDGALQRVVETTVLRHMMKTAEDAQTSAGAKALLQNRLKTMARSFQSRGGTEPVEAWAAHYSFLAREVDKWFKDPKSTDLPPAPEAPPGMPIGADEEDWCGWAWRN